MERKNPYEVLGISINTDMDTLKRKFKKLALIMHPDRGGSAALFDLLKDCYMKISKDIKTREIEKQFNELKLECDEHMAKELAKQQTVEKKIERIDPQNFSQSFNKLFEDNKSKNVNDRGYGKLMVDSQAERADIKVPHTFEKFNLNKFNKTFEKQDTPSKKIVKKYEPDAFALNKQLNYLELGVDKIVDFSGANMTNKDLNYMDYKLAHSTSKLIDTSSKDVPSRKYKDLETDRKTVPTKMTNKETTLYNKHMKNVVKKEHHRLSTLNKEDEEAFRKFEKLNALMIGSVDEQAR